MAEQPLKLRFLLQPDLDRPIGGAKQVHRQVEQLVDLGWDAAVMAEKAGFRPGWFESKAPVLAYSDCRASGELASSHTILVLPETYLGIDLGNYYDVDLRRQPRVVFNQNVYYSTMGAGTKPLEQLAAFYDAPEVLQVLCESGDFLRVPAGTKHWFDMGSAPHFTALRFFDNPAGWVAEFTGDPIADRFPLLD